MKHLSLDLSNQCSPVQKEFGKQIPHKVGLTSAVMGLHGHFIVKLFYLFDKQILWIPSSAILKVMKHVANNKTTTAWYESTCSDTRQVGAMLMKI